MSTQTSGVDDADQEREQRADGETPTRLGRGREGTSEESTVTLDVRSAPVRGERLVGRPQRRQV